MNNSSNTLESSSSIIRTDWSTHLNNWKASGQSQAEYCRRHNLKYCVFHYWKKKLWTGSSSNVSGSSETKFVEVKGRFGQSSSSVPAKGQLSGGLRFWYGEFCIEVEREFSPLTLLELVRTLQEL